MIIASSSPTIIQKESSDSSSISTVVSSASGSPALAPISAGCGQNSAANNSDADAELVIVDQTLYDSAGRHPLTIQLGAGAGTTNLIAVVAQAAQDPLKQSASGHQSAGSLVGQLPTVGSQVNVGGTVAPELPPVSHAPLNASNTMKQAPTASSNPSSSPRKTVSSASGEFSAQRVNCISFHSCAQPTD